MLLKFKHEFEVVTKDIMFIPNNPAILKLKLQVDGCDFYFMCSLCEYIILVDIISSVIIVCIVLYYIVLHCIT